MTSWRRLSLATILEPRKTKDIPAKFPDLPYIGMEHVAKEIGTIESLGVSAEYRSSAPKVKQGDVLYGRLRPYLNKVVIAPFDAFASGEFIVLPENEAITSKFLQYRLLSQDFVEFAGTLDTGDRPRVSWDQISKFEIELPSLPEQKMIVEILEEHLSRLDAALADVKQAKAKAAQFRRSLLQAAFTGNLIGDGIRLMTEPPPSWQVVQLGKLGKWITGSTPKSSNPLNFGNDVDFVTPSDIAYGGTLGPSERKISNLGASTVRVVKAPSVNLVCIGTIGKVALAKRDVTTNQQINSLEVDTAVANPNFVMWLLASPELQEKLWENASSTTVAILNKGNLEKIQTYLPSLPEQNKIVEILEDHLSRLDASVAIADAMEKQSSSLRRSLLQAAFTGQLTKEVASV
jgi:type I restriction enzyme S subunit